MATARWTCRASALIAGLALGTVACGGAPEPQIIGPDPCIAGQADLKQRLGPEFAKMVTTEGFARDRLRGCALIYLRVAEELPEEMPDGDDLDLEPMLPGPAEGEHEAVRVSSARRAGPAGRDGGGGGAGIDYVAFAEDRHEGSDP